MSDRSTDIIDRYRMMWTRANKKLCPYQIEYTNGWYKFYTADSTDSFLSARRAKVISMTETLQKRAEKK